MNTTVVNSWMRGWVFDYRYQSLSTSNAIHIFFERWGVSRVWATNSAALYMPLHWTLL